MASAVDRGFEPRSGQIKDYRIGICCFSAKHEAFRRKSKDWLARNENNVNNFVYDVFMVLYLEIHYRKYINKIVYFPDRANMLLYVLLGF